MKRRLRRAPLAALELHASDCWSREHLCLAETIRAGRQIRGVPSGNGGCDDRAFVGAN